MLASLTGKDASDWDITLNDEENMNITADVTYSSLSQTAANAPGKTGGSTEIILASAIIAGCIIAVKFKGSRT
jgi:hypothetical protein